MSHENVEIVRRAQPDAVDMVKLFRGSNDPDTAVTPPAVGIDATVFDDDFEVEFISGVAGSMRPPSRGPEGFIEAWLDWLEPWQSYYVEFEDILDAGDQVVSLVHVRAKAAPGAVPVEHRSAAVWSLRHGRIIGIRFYLERDKALEAAGLRE
jgi:ketosteroid isomerase-like protein